MSRIYICAVSPKFPTLKRVEGKIFVHAQRELILPLISGVPNLEAIAYDVRVSLRT